VQRTARDQRDESESRRSTRDIESRDTDRRSRWRVYDDDDDPEFSDDDGRAVLIHREPRW
jgi:hypothetical protein